MNLRNKLENLASIKVFNRWSGVYALTLLLSLIYNSVYTFLFYDFSDLFINYQGGFIRRGLLGELFYWLNLKGINPIYVAYSMSLLAYVVILGYMSCQFNKRGYAVGLLLVSCLLPMFTILSTDYTRILMYAGLSFYIVFFELTDKESSNLFPPIIINIVEKLINRMDRFMSPSRFKILFYC